MANRRGIIGRWTDRAILRESERWLHVPAACTLVENGERLLVHPPGFRGTSRVWRSWPARARAEGLILETIEEVRTSGGARLVWHTGDAISPPFMDDLLQRHGFEKTEDLELLAFELEDDPDPNLPRLDVPDDIHVDLVRDEAEILQSRAVASHVFPNSPKLTDPEIRAYLYGIETLGRRKPEPGDAAYTLRFLAFMSDQMNRSEGAVATAGAQVVDETVRLWGAGTLAEHRGRGAYRALVVERCRFAHALGATLALTRANMATSAPLLQNAGFRPVGSERRHQLRIPDENNATTKPTD